MQGVPAITYQYRVRDPLGNTHEGSVDAVSLEDAARQLRQDGFEIVALDEQKDSPLFRRRVTKREIIYTTSQLSIMVDTGITISAALSGIISQEENPTLREVLEDLRQSVEAGSDFSSALAKHPTQFNQTYVSLVKAAEATGTLGRMLERIAGYLRREVENRGRVRAAMAYPTVMVCVAIAVTIFLLTYILPKFIPLFESRGADLPGPTKILMGVSTVLLNYWVVWALLAAALVAGFIFGKRTEQGRIAWDWFKLNCPLTGKTYRKVVLSRSIRTLATMIAAGVSVVESLELCGEVASNIHYKRMWDRVVEQVMAGQRIHDALAGNPLVPSVLVQMIASGEETGKLDYVLERVSDYYDQEVEAALKTTTSLIEPLMIAALGFVVGGIGMALLLPIF
ncbi:MAG: type II secretion system F family protein, partial [Pirellulaceae bacterium]|nr:type II secretion system F family protein [Pirellulaceae bacterium]